MLDAAGAVIVQVFVVVGGDVAAVEVLLNPRQELGVDGHDVFKVAVLGAIFDHPHLAVALNDLSFDLAHVLINQDPVVVSPVNNPVARLSDAGGAEGIRAAGETQDRLGLFPGFLQRFL